MQTEYGYRGGMEIAWDSATAERIMRRGSPFYFEDDFVGADGLAAIPAVSSEERGVKWAKVIVGSATVANVADAANGAVAVALDATSEAQDAVLSFGDQLCFDITNGGIIEFRAQLSVLPTTAVTAVMGLAGPHNLAKDDVANHAWFRWDGSAVGYVETDDTTNNNDGVATGLTTVVSTYGIYRIDFFNLADVKFYVDGARVGAGTTFDMSNLSAAEKIMQPYISLDKASGTVVGTIQADYVRFAGPRGA
jgi:hypothetical protein